MRNDTTTASDGATLLAEIRRYLAAVDAFREQGLEPQWRPEPEAAGVPRPSRLDRD
jgi:hypothetical protein